MRWIWAEDGSAIQVHHITRLFITMDAVAKHGSYVLKASLAGPAQPYVISRHETYEIADEALKDLIVGRGESCARSR